MWLEMPSVVCWNFSIYYSCPAELRLVVHKNIQHDKGYHQYANSVVPDQTAWSGSIMFDIEPSKVQQQTTKQITF